MYYLLYNEKSNHGKAKKTAHKLYKRLIKHNDVEFLSIYLINGKEKEFIMSKKKDDCIVLIGGDGTVHQFINRIRSIEITCRVFLKSCGRGNDLARDYKRHRMFEITELCKQLPTLKVNQNKEYAFINGVGMGVDSLVCQQQIQNSKTQTRESYFAIALRIFKRFTPYSLDIELDGEKYHFDRVWFFVCNHGCYFGGGMKITPKAIREDDLLDICIVHSIGLFSLLTVFPLVFIGKHIWFRKKSITMLRGHHLKAKPFGCTILQQDGDVLTNVSEIEVQR